MSFIDIFWFIPQNTIDKYSNILKLQTQFGENSSCCNLKLPRISIYIVIYEHKSLKIKVYSQGK